jgi:rhodanese-related sulfurtransferase
MNEPQTSKFSRRALMGLLVGGGCVAAVYAFGDTAVSVPITPDEALQRIADDSLLLIDIRRPDEWELTGVATGAAPIDMRDEDFLEQIDRLLAGNKAAPIALICARGVRSRRLAAKLKTAGYTGVVDVSEGMLGSAAGVGWIARGLPISPYKTGVSE